MENNVYVYIHKRLDNNEIFYVGIGTQKNYKRAYDIYDRSSFWKKVFKKSKISVEILHENLSWETACKIEIELIAKYGRKNLNKGTLVNLTDGGQGSPNTINSEETRKRKSDAAKNKPKSQKHKENSKNACKGISKSLEHKLKLANNCPRKKKLIDVSTGIIYNSITEAAKALNYKRTAIQAWLSGQNTNKTNLKYYE